MRSLNTAFVLMVAFPSFAPITESRGAQAEPYSVDESDRLEARHHIGERVEDFVLPVISDQGSPEQFSLSQYESAQVFVLVWLGTECPVANKYMPRLNRMAQNYAAEHVQFVGILANAQETPEDRLGFYREYNQGGRRLHFPLLHDEGAQFTDRVGALRTPEVLVLDGERRARYWGRIDNQFQYGGVTLSEPTENDLRDSLDAVLAGKVIIKSCVEPVGCYIGRASREPQGQEFRITYANAIADIMNRHCVDCHHDGGAGPMDLTVPDNVVAWGNAIVEQTTELGLMPPWFVSHELNGVFANERVLADEEKETLIEWQQYGCPLGNRDEVPPPPDFDADADLDEFPEPTKTLRMKQPQTIPVLQRIPYRQIEFDPQLESDGWYVIRLNPDNKKVCHHLTLSIEYPKEWRGLTDVQGVLMGGYLPGMRSAGSSDLSQQAVDPELAKFVPAGAKFVLTAHYHNPRGTPQEDNTYLTMYEVDGDLVTSRSAAIGSNLHEIEIQPHEKKVITDTTVLAENFRALAVTLHMHLRGHSCKMLAIYPPAPKELLSQEELEAMPPDERLELKPLSSEQRKLTEQELAAIPWGTTQVLFDVPRYNFDWQMPCWMNEVKVLPQGTRLRSEFVFDNTSANPNLTEDDANQVVRYGPFTDDEMANLNLISVVDASDVKALIAKGPATRRPNTAARKAASQIRYAVDRATKTDNATDGTSPGSPNLFVRYFDLRIILAVLVMIGVGHALYKRTRSVRT